MKELVKNKKKKSIYTFGIMTKICLIVSLSIFTTCKEDNEPELQNKDTLLLVENINIVEMAEHLLPEFQLVEENSIDSVRTQYQFFRESDTAGVSIILGIYSDSKKAKDAAIFYISTMSLYHEEGPYQDFLVGDEYWYVFYDMNPDHFRNIIFLRNNVLIMMYCSYEYHNLKSLAKEIDDGILNKETYVKFYK